MPDEYGAYQRTIYTDGMQNNVRPVITTDLRHLEKQARKVMHPRAFNYIAGGAGEKATMDSNRLAFRQWKLIPRMLNTFKVDISIELFGQRYPSPVLMAPIGVQSLAHANKETGLAKACADVNIPYIMSTTSSSTFQQVAAGNGNGKRWYQLYWPNDNEVTLSLLQRARDHGFQVLVVTLDIWMQAWRPADLDSGYLPFLSGVGTEFGLSDPIFRAKYEAQTGSRIEDDIPAASKEWMSCIVGQNHSWEDVAFLRKNWDGPIVLKGIQHAEDGKMALRCGCDGIVVSNHGGRQLDGAIGSLEVLPEIVDAVGSQMTVLFDSGIRTGSDILKALSLGAKAVLVGRPVIYGYAIHGQDGAKEVLRGLLADLCLSMAIAGVPSIADCSREIVRRVPYGGDLKAML